MIARVRSFRLAAALPVAALAATLTLAGCGGSDDSGGDAPEQPSQAEIDDALASTKEDAKTVSDAVVAEYKQSQAFPESADDLAELSEGNEIGGYEVNADTAEICVHHVVDGEGVATASYLVNAAGGQVSASELSSGTGPCV